MALDTIVGTWSNPDGSAVANGSLFLVLSQPATVTATSQIVPTAVSFQLTASGALPTNAQIYGNDQLSPAGTVYFAHVTNSSGQTVWTQTLSIGGVSPINLNNLVAAVGNISLVNPVLQNPIGAQTITGQSLTLTSSAPLIVQGTATLSGGGSLSGTFTGNPIFSGLITAATATFAGLNGILVVGAATGQYASLQAAHDALPSAGGTIFVAANGTPFGVGGTTVLAITKPIHVIFDAGSYTYSGSTSPVISCTGVRGVTIEGAGHRGDDTGTSGTTINVSNTTVTGVTTSGCNGFTLRSFNLLGPGSGSGQGIVNSSGRSTFANLNISSWGSDGWTNDGSAVNSNTILVSRVRSSANGGNGFTAKGINGQNVSFISTDGSANTGDGYNIQNELNMFLGTNADSNTGFDYHCATSSCNYNGGLIFSNNAGVGPPGGIKFDVNTAGNNFQSVGPATNAIVTDLGVRNYVLTNGSKWSVGGVQAVTTLKKGSAIGNYTSTSVTYVRVDATNLLYSTAIPFGYSLVVSVTGSATSLTGVASIKIALTDAGTLLQEISMTPSNAALAEPFALSYIVAGDGGSHSIDLRFLTNNAADAVSINNVGTAIPVMAFQLVPWN